MWEEVSNIDAWIAFCCCMSSNPQQIFDDGIPEHSIDELEIAVAALRDMKKYEVEEIKSYINPPRSVEKVGEAICLLMSKEPSWSEFKRLCAG
jgi:hypothetical protein